MPSNAARPNSDELAMTMALMGRLASAGVVSEATLKAITDELQRVALAGEPPEGGITSDFRIAFKDGAVFASDRWRR